MKSKKITLVFIIGLAMMFFGALQEATCGQPVDFECEVFRRVNDERATRGLPELAWNEMLFNAARAHALDMAAHGTLSHTGSDGSQFYERIIAAGYAFRACAENIAYNYADPAAVMAGWMASEGHRQNILDANFCELGVGLAYSDTHQPYWTQNFGRPVSACPEPAAAAPCDDEAGIDPDNEAADGATRSDLEGGSASDTDALGAAGGSGGGGGGCLISSLVFNGRPGPQLTGFQSRRVSFAHPNPK